MKGIRTCKKHGLPYFVDEGCEDCYKEYLERRKLISELRKEFESLPEKNRYSLGSRGVDILNKIHKLELKQEGKDHE